MAGNINWNGTPTQSFGFQLSGQGAQITNTTATALSGILDNTGASGGPAFFAIAELALSASGFGAAVSGLTSIDFYMVPSRDGTNFPAAYVGGPLIPPASFRGSFIISISGNTVNTINRMNIEAIPLMPLKYQGYIVNNTLQTITSGWGITIDLYQEAYT